MVFVHKSRRDHRRVLLGVGLVSKLLEFQPAQKNWNATLIAKPVFAPIIEPPPEPVFARRTLGLPAAYTAVFPVGLFDFVDEAVRLIIFSVLPTDQAPV